jgi:YidC/Oxa1 family membrane protein insertase
MSIASVFNLLLYQPLFNALVILYDYLPGHDFGAAVIALTIIIRLILYPSTAKATKTQKALNTIQPKLKEIQDKYKDDKERQVKETLEVYKQAEINPFGGLLSTFIQIPILLALYWVFRKGFNPSELVNLYNFVLNPGIINAKFIGLVDLSKPNVIMAVLATVTQFFQVRMMAPKIKSKSNAPDFSVMMQKQMVYFLPFITFFILLGLPSALGLYWATGSLFLIAEQYIISKPKKNPPAAKPAEIKH